MFDIVLRASNRADMRAFAIANGLGIMSDGEFISTPGVEWSWWSGSGKLQMRAAQFDADGVEKVSAQVAPGVIALVRIEDKIALRGAGLAARYKADGATGDDAGIRYRELDGVRQYLLSDVNDFLASRGLPGHEFAGGNLDDE